MFSSQKCDVSKSPKRGLLAKNLNSTYTNTTTVRHSKLKCQHALPMSKKTAVAESKDADKACDWVILQIAPMDEMLK